MGVLEGRWYHEIYGTAVQFLGCTHKYAGAQPYLAINDDGYSSALAYT